MVVISEKPLGPVLSTPGVVVCAPSDRSETCLGLATLSTAHIPFLSLTQWLPVACCAMAPSHNCQKLMEYGQDSCWYHFIAITLQPQSVAYAWFGHKERAKPWK